MRSNLSYAFIGSLIALGSLPASAGMVIAYPYMVSSDTSGSVVGNTTESASGFGTGSWQATGVESNFYITPQALFGHDVLIGDISSMTYWTNQMGTLSRNWNLYIYTTPDSLTTNSAGWYKSKLVGSAPDGVPGWNQQTTATLDWSDPDRNNTNYTGTGVTWANIEAGGVTWPSGTPRDYRMETVKFFSLHVASNAPQFRGLLDGLQITLSNNDSASVNFEPIPEPATLTLFGIGAGLLGLARRYRR